MTTAVPPVSTRHHRVIIIGSGPAGLTAAIYAARANLEPLVIGGNVPMGQLMITSEVENYHGFPDGVQGPEQMGMFRAQAMLERREEYRGSRIMQDRALAHPKIDVLWNKEVAEVRGDMTVTSLDLRDTTTGETSELAVQGLFIAIGYKPNTDLFAGQLDIGEGGYLEVVGETGSRVEGVFIAGDVHDHHYRQAVTAAGDGCKAAIDAERWLASIGVTEQSTATSW